VQGRSSVRIKTLDRSSSPCQAYTSGGGLAVYTDKVDGMLRYREHLDATTLHLIGGGPYLTVDRQRREVPEGSKQLLALVALRRRRGERRWAAGTLWAFPGEERAAGNPRASLWRLRRARIYGRVARQWALALGP